MSCRSLRLGLLLLALTAQACSFSASSESISDSISSPSKSSSSSSPGASEAEYREDVRDYTAVYVTSQGDPDEFQQDIAKLAGKHGITDWERSTATWEGIGAGLAKAKVTDGQLIAYKRTLGNSEPAKMDAIQKGYDSAR